MSLLPISGSSRTICRSKVDNRRSHVFHEIDVHMRMVGPIDPPRILFAGQTPGNRQGIRIKLKGLSQK